MTQSLRLSHPPFRRAPTIPAVIHERTRTDEDQIEEGIRGGGRHAHGRGRRRWRARRRWQGRGPPAKAIRHRPQSPRIWASPRPSCGRSSGWEDTGPDRGRTGQVVSGLEDAIYKDVQAHLDQAVKNGRLTVAQEQVVLAG